MKKNQREKEMTTEGGLECQEERTMECVKTEENMISYLHHFLKLFLTFEAKVVTPSSAVLKVWRGNT